jgi:ornithine cyclodeaminase/alanine dehydrogenase-like protein (mu-crystallin family)
VTWLLNNDDVAQVLTIDDCLEVLEDTFRDYAQGKAVNRPRAHSYAPIGESPQMWYMFKTMDAIVPRHGVGGIRLTSDIVIEKQVDGKLRREKPGLAPGGRWTELLFLFSIQTGELLAIVHGGYLQRLRVGATSGLCAKYVAQTGAKRVALIGTGGLAGPHLEALSRIFILENVKVYSPSEEHRKNFVDYWCSKLGLHIKVVENPYEAIKDTQIISLVTNSLSPVLEGDWLRPGMHVNSVQRGELDRRTIERSDFIVIRSRDRDSHWYIGPRAPEEVKFDQSETPALTAKMRTLGGIIAGLEEGRSRADQITLFGGSGLGSAGLGIQLLSVAARAFEKAKQRGLGRELPSEWFSQEIHT